MRLTAPLTRVEEFDCPIMGQRFTLLLVRSHFTGRCIGVARLHLDGDPIQLYDLFVTESCRRRGVATELVRAGEAVAAREGRRLVAYTNPENTASESLFRALNWRIYDADHSGAMANGPVCWWESRASEVSP